MELTVTTTPLVDNMGGRIESFNSGIISQADVITADYKKNKKAILDILCGIDLSRSKLPADFLDHKEKEADRNNPFRPGDFQVKITGMINRLKNDNSEYDFDISSVDRYLFLIAKILAGAVASGCKETAIAARQNLATGLLRVRTNLLIPQDMDSRVRYAEKCTEYLSICYTYVSVMNMIDVTNSNIEQQKKFIEAETKKIENSKEMLADLILTSPPLAEGLREANRTTFIEAGSTWKREIVDLYEMIVQMRIAESNLKFKGLHLEIQEKRLFFYREASEKLKAYVASVPVPEDAGLMDKMQDLVSSTISEADKVQSDFLRLNDMMEKFSESVRSLSDNSKKSEFIGGDLDKRISSGGSQS